MLGPSSNRPAPPSWFLQTGGRRSVACLLGCWLLIGLGSRADEIELFNGENLDGFYTWLADARYEDPRAVFTATNRMIRISGEGLGYMATRKTYGDFRLRLEFKWGDRNWKWGDRIGKARDSGIFLRAVGPDGNSEDGGGAFMAAVECNVFEGAVGDFLLIRGRDAGGELLSPRITANVRETRDSEGWPYWDPNGEPMTLKTWGRLNWFQKDPEWKDVLGFRGRKDVERPHGEWNRLEFLCREGEISVRLNGTLVNQAREAAPREGRILLQCEGSEIFYRNLKLELL